MLVINGVVAILGILIACAIYWLQTVFIFQPYSLIILCGLGLWVLLSGADLIEFKLVELFNKEAR